MIDIEAQNRFASFLGRKLDASQVVDANDSPIGGGYSRVMIRFDVTINGVPRSLVARMDPPPDRSVAKSDRGAEWNVLNALTRYGRVSLPAAHCYDADGEVFGQPMIISDFIPSSTLIATLRNTPHEQFRDYAEKLADLAASIHRVPLSTLSGLEIPKNWDAYIDSRIEEWRAIERENYERDPFIRYLAAWLDSHRPAPAPLCLVHGDFHAANSIVAEDDGRLLAIDWEFPHVGDPRVDLGWFLLMAGIQPPDLMTAEFDVFLDRYRANTGLSADIVNKDTINYFQILAGTMLFGGTFRQTSALARGEVANHTLLYVTGVTVLAHELWFGKSQMLEAALGQKRRVA